MKKILTMMMVAVLALSMLAGCGSTTTTGSVATDGSTSMEKVIGALKETFEGEMQALKLLTTPPAPVPASRLFRKAAATLVFLPVI